MSRIAEITTYPLRIPFKPGLHSAASAWGPAGLNVVDTLLTRVTTDNGIVGWGESFGFVGLPVTRQAIDAVIAPLCIGADASNIRPLMLALQKKLHVFGRGGPLTHALSAIDIALWDIAGKAAGVPIHRLLGGARELSLTCYASLDAYGAADSVRVMSRRAVDDGFTGIKLHERDRTVIAEARDEIGPDIDLMVDVNCAWSTAEAVQAAEALLPLDLKWLEEPVWPPENFDGLAAVRRTGMPTAAGENVGTVLELDRLLKAEAVAFVQPSVAKIGGVTELQRTFDAAALRNVTIMPHTFYDGPGLLASLHTTAALAGPDPRVEWRYFDLEANVYGDRLHPVGGQIQVPQGPGLGLDPEPDVLRTYRLR
jgi:L-alanine-DL-glutamate epimerase-like enolase superfamily enzyme